MGKSDIALKQWLRNKVRFADLFNGIVFKGEQVILPEELEESESEASMISEDKEEKEKGLQRYRDIVMKWRKGTRLTILACENQERVHYAMPVRILLYDGMAYSDQIRQIWGERNSTEEVTEEEYLSHFRKEDKIYPVITLIFYYGLKPWDGSVDLYGMFHQEKEIREKKVLQEYVHNYPLNLIDVGNIEDEKRFRTDLQLIFGMLKYRGKQKELNNYLNANRDYFEQVDIESYRAMRALLHSERQLKKLKPEGDRKGTVNMCKALEDLYNDGVDAGIERGIEQGVEAVIRVLIKICKEFGLSREEILSRIKKEFSMTEEAALRCLEQYEA